MYYMFMELMNFSGCDFGVAIVEAGWLQIFQMNSHNAGMSLKSGSAAQRRASIQRGN